MSDAESQILEFLEEGLFLYGVGRTQEAVSRWRKVLELDPGNERALDYIRTAGIDPATVMGGASASAGVGAGMGGGPVPPTPASSPSPPPPRPSSPPPPRAQPAPPPIPSSPAAAPPPMAPPMAPPPQTTQPSAPMPTPMSSTTNPSAAVDAPPVQSADTRKREVLGIVAKHYKAGDHDAAYDVLAGICSEFPNDAALTGYLDRLKGEMSQKYVASMGSLERIPQLSVSQGELMNRQLSPEEGFVISRIDGSGTIDDLLTMLGLDRFTGLRALHKLHQAGLIVFV